MPAPRTAKTPPHSGRFLEPLRRFQLSLNAVRDVEDFVDANRQQLEDPEDAFVVEARRRFPEIEEAVHREAARAIHSWSHYRQRKIKEQAEQKTPAEERVQQGAFDARKLRAELLQLTGIPEYYVLSRPVWSRAVARPRTHKVVRSSLLVNAVSEFEVLVSSLVRGLLKAKPEALRASKREYTFREIDAFRTMEEFRAHCAEQVADNLLRGSYEDWMGWFADKHQVVVPGVTDCPQSLVEIFQRRHLLVHAGGVVNRYYLDKITSAPQSLKINDVLDVDRDYLLSAIDQLTSAAMKLTFAVVIKFSSGEPHVEHNLARAIYQALVDGYYAVVEDVGGWSVNQFKQSQHQLVAQVNVWVARKQLRGLEDIAAEVAAWETNVLSGRYRLTKLALLDRHEEAYALSKKLLKSEDLATTEWMEWPALEGTRAYAANTEQEELPDDAEIVFDSAHVDLGTNPINPAEDTATPSVEHDAQSDDDSEGAGKDDAGQLDGESAGQNNEVADQGDADDARDDDPGNLDD